MFELNTIWLLITALITGAVTGGLFIGYKIQKKCNQRLFEYEGKLKANEATFEALKVQTDQKDKEINKLRDDFAKEIQIRVAAETELKSSLENIRQQRKLLEDSKKELTDTFSALSSSALKSSNEEFLNLAKESLGKILSETKGKLGEHQMAMDGIIKPLRETLKRYEEQIAHIEAKRRQDYGGIGEQLKLIMSTHQQLQRETSNLVTALKRPQVRGRWGELQLKRAVELAGMSAYCDFSEQTSIDTDKGRLRPDMVIHLPNERDIVVDAKVSLDAYLDAISAESEENRNGYLKKHAQQIREHMNRLSQKAYWEQLESSPEFVVLFLPGESFFSAALENDRDLLEDGILKKIILSTPTTLITLLRAVAYGWRQEQMTKNAEEISRIGKELYERILVFVKHLDIVGNSLNKSVSAYNSAIGSLESRVLPSVRRFKELGAAKGQEINSIDQIDHFARKPIDLISNNQSEDS